MFTIRLFEPQQDTLFVYALWQQTVGHLWPLSFDVFHELLITDGAYQ